MSEPQIGQIGNWVRRWKGKWHLVESTVAGDVITRCGRRMDKYDFGGEALQVSVVMPLTRMIGQPQLCKAGCEADITWVPNELIQPVDPTVGT